MACKNPFILLTICSASIVVIISEKEPWTTPNESSWYDDETNDDKAGKYKGNQNVVIEQCWTDC